MGAGASLQAPEGEAFTEGVSAIDATTVQKGVLITEDVVRAFGTADDAFKCRIFDAVYASQQERFLDTAAYEGTAASPASVSETGEVIHAKEAVAGLTVEEKSQWVEELQAKGREGAEAVLALAKGVEEGLTEALPAVELLNYKTDVVTKLALCTEEPEARAATLGQCRDVIVSAWVAATKLQAIMRGRAERKKHAKRKGKKKHKK